RRAVDAQHPPVLECEQIAPPQTREAHGRVAFRGQVAVRREPQVAALGGGVEPTGERGQVGVGESLGKDASVCPQAEAWARHGAVLKHIRLTLYGGVAPSPSFRM